MTQTQQQEEQSRVFVSLGGHTVYADGSCTRLSCGRRHPYIVPAGQA